MKKKGDIDTEYHVSLWHPWLDTPGVPKVPVYWQAGGAVHSPLGKIYSVSNLEQVFSTIGRNELFCLCDDLLSVEEFPFANDLIGDKRAKPFLSRSGCAALKITSGRKIGYFIPASTWCWREDELNKQLLENLNWVFRKVGFQATTPPSLSEKVLRSTLPTPVGISRPSVMLRHAVLANHRGGRVDSAKSPYKIWNEVYRYDKIKGYPSFASSTPSPFISPCHLVLPSVERCLEYAAAWCHCYLVYRQCYPDPLDHSCDKAEGEVLDIWLWDFELQDCLDAGYQLVKIERAYCWTKLSNFMEEWSHKLFALFEEARNEHPHIQKIIKQMMVGLPGRFLCQPEEFQLIDIVDAVPGQDIPLALSYRAESERHFSDWAIRPVYKKEATALCQVGSYIVAKMRSELYHLMCLAKQQRRQVIMTYVDCISVDGPLEGIPLGSAMGQYKEERMYKMYAESNRFIAQTDYEMQTGDNLTVKAPAYGKDTDFGRMQRIAFLQRRERMLENIRINEFL
jgi:hypothetical protein